MSHVYHTNWLPFLFNQLRASPAQETADSIRTRSIRTAVLLFLSSGSWDTMIPRGDSSIALIKRLNVRIGRVTSIYTKASALGSYVVGSRSLLA